MEHVTNSPPRSLASLAEALRLAGGISDSTRRRIPDFPKPVVLSRTKAGRPCRIAFVREEVLAWCEERIRARRFTAQAVLPPEAT